MKLIITLFFTLFFINAVAQEPTINKILDNTKGVLDLVNSIRSNSRKDASNKINEDKKEGDVQTNSQHSNLNNYSNIGKFQVKNLTQKRIIVTIKSLNEANDFQKEFVISIGDFEIFKNLSFGIYSYVAKFDDGNIARSGEFELNSENRSIEKDIK